MDTTQQSEWEPCPAGELTKMVDARCAARRRKVIDRFAVGAAAVMVFIAVGGFSLGLFTPDLGTQPTTLTCSDVVPQLPAYVQGDLDETTRTNIASHLSHCKSCQSKYETLAQSIAYVVSPGLALLRCLA